ncbi:hypothetical protein CRV15_29970 (plasmid) [Streptomyces clavuligerus]|nr:hypothetical protein CRV15_29970 [Streptomyces clavuligerus]
MVRPFGMWSPALMRSRTSALVTVRTPRSIALTSDWARPVTAPRRVWLAPVCRRTRRKTVAMSRSASARRMAGRSHSSCGTVKSGCTSPLPEPGVSDRDAIERRRGRTGCQGRRGSVQGAVL